MARMSTFPSDDMELTRLLVVSDVGRAREWYETLRGRGAAFLAEPVDSGYEIRAFFRDPDGHLFEISEIAG